MRKLLFVTMILLFTLSVWAEEGSKEFKQKFPAASFSELVVSNRYGNIDIRQGGEEFVITASVWVEAKNKAKVDEMLEYITIVAKDRGPALNVETVYQKDMSLKQMFAGVTVSVDYHIKVPEGKKVRLVNSDGGITMTDFVGNMEVEIKSGNFKANTVLGGEFSVKQSGGEFEVEKVAVFNGVFKDCKRVKIGEGTDMKFDCSATNLQLMEANALTMKTSGGSCYLGAIEDLSVNSSSTKYEVQDIGGTLWLDARWERDERAEYQSFFFFYRDKRDFNKDRVDVYGRMWLLAEIERNKAVKVELPWGISLDTKPTTSKNTLLETGFVGDKKFTGKVNLKLSGGSLFIQ